MVLATKYKQAIIINGDTWQHDLENTLSTFTAVIIDYYYNYNYNYDEYKTTIDN